MKWLIVGNGIQGQKRRKLLGDKCIGILDPYTEQSDFNSLNSIEENYDVMAICTPQSVKLDYINYCVENSKPCLIEKPFPIISSEKFDSLQAYSKEKGAFIYTAFNHRFEESLKKFQEIFESGKIGEPYFLHMRYGNGTVIDINNSPWKKGANGLLLDLGSHLFDLHKMLFGKTLNNLRIEKTTTNEFGFEDYVRISGDNLLLELGYIFWKSDFRVEVWGSRGSLHALGLKKWGNSQLIYRERAFPSGVPEETIYDFPGMDSTWKLEHEYVENQVRQKVVGISSEYQEMNELMSSLIEEL